uniref:Putative ribonuclease H-like domain-containing protein n=1 Tax=Tanacetum cinerariifolium TaxID=118510 RepID=A0A699ISC5_TANCI|nr:putative ribonuclease H-like domain-containing protein [Tanacetum cinerariifolium]
MFWTEAVRTACYVLNRVSVTSPHNKTPYALLTGNIPSVSHFKPFGCHVTIINTSDHLGKFDEKADESYIVGYSASNKAYMVYNVPNKRVEESMNIWFLEEKPNVQGLGHEWYLNLDYLTDSLGYKHVLANQPAGTQGATTNSTGTQDANLDSDCDEQVIIELARVKNQEHRVIFNAESLALGTTYKSEDLQTPLSANPVPPGCIPVPTGKVPVPTGSLLVPTGSIPVPAAAAMVPTDDVLVHSSSSTDLMFDGEPTTRFPCPSDLEIMILHLVFSLLHPMMMGLILLSTMSHPLWKTTTTPYEAPKPKSKNESDSLVNVHLYRSMIGSLMYLTALRPDIMFAVSACLRHQVTPTTSNLEAVKKIFKYLKGQPKFCLWYFRESPLVLEAYSDSDYAGENKDRKSTTSGCQFLGRRLISWKCKKQTIVATSSTEVEYVAAANCCAHVLWIQNQLVDNGHNFMNTNIFIDN